MAARLRPLPRYGRAITAMVVLSRWGAGRCRNPRRHGGITAAGDNITEACGLAFEGREARGCSAPLSARAPGYPSSISQAARCIRRGSRKRCVARLAPGLGPRRIRPAAPLFAEHLVHGCPRNEYYEYKAAAHPPGQLGCLMENLGCIGMRGSRPCEGSCVRGGYPCIGCTEPGFGERLPYSTLKRGGIPLGLPTDMPKAWFVALAALAKAATPERLRRNATAETIPVAPSAGPGKQKK